MHTVEDVGISPWPVDALKKQVDVKQLYNQVPQTAWVSWSSSCSSRQWEPVPDRGIGPSGPRLSSPAEWGRSTAIVRGTWGQYVAVCSASNSPLTYNQYQLFREKSVKSLFFSRTVFVRHYCWLYFRMYMHTYSCTMAIQHAY